MILHFDLPILSVASVEFALISLLVLHSHMRLDISVNGFGNHLHIFAPEPIRSALAVYVWFRLAMAVSFHDSRVFKGIEHTNANSAISDNRQVRVLCSGAWLSCCD